MADYDVQLETVEPERVISKRAVVANYGAVSGLLGELIEEMQADDLEPNGPPMAIYFDEEYKEHDVDVEAAYPIAETIEASDTDLIVKTLGGGTFARVVHRGPYDDFRPAYQALMDWIPANGYRIVGPNREVYIRGPESDVDPEDYLTRILFPVAPA